MRMTFHADLGFRTLVYLAAAAPEGSTIPQIAEAYDVSENHLRKVTLHLTKLGLVDSTRGKGGGLKLAKDPSKISIGWAMRRLEPDFAIAECMGAEPQRWRDDDKKNCIWSGKPADGMGGKVIQGQAECDGTKLYIRGGVQ